jgi:uncharacterized membrane protein (TIGR02234 family)
VSASIGALTVTAWAWVTVAAGVLAIAAGALTVGRSGDWPAMGRRYESGGSARRGPVTEASHSQATLWDRLDEGDDPTV